MQRVRGRHLQPSSSSPSSSAAATVSGTTVEDVLDGNVEVETGDTSYDEADATAITLSGSGADSDSDAVTVEDGTVTISAAGTYVLSGELTGQVVVDSAGDGVVRLVLDDATITSETTAAIDVVDAQSVVVVLADGSTNALADAATYADTSEDAPTGTLYSTADLTIGGTGSLTVTGNSNNGIVGKDGLVITGGTIDVTSVDDGILGKDYLVLTDGTVTVDAVGDTFKSDNTEDAGSGFVLVEGGELTVTSQDDGIKGVQVLIGGGTVDVAGSDEALEGSLIVIDDGDVELHAADDGVNAASSDDSASTDGQPGGAMAADDSLALYVNGGTLEVWASGDGLDSNGSATITGGEITVYGPTTDGNGALDVNGTFDVSGGTLDRDRQRRDDGRPVDRLRPGLDRHRPRHHRGGRLGGRHHRRRRRRGGDVHDREGLRLRRLLVRRHHLRRDLHGHRRRHRDDRHRGRGARGRPRRPDGRLTSGPHAPAPLPPRHTKEPR